MFAVCAAQGARDLRALELGYRKCKRDIFTIFEILRFLFRLEEEIGSANLVWLCVD